MVTKWNLKSHGYARSNKGGYELLGETFGRLTVIARSDELRSDGCRMWDCMCRCGTKTTVGGTQLVTGKTASCGCYAREKSSVRATTHGESPRLGKKQPARLEYNSYNAAKNRCTNPRNIGYHLYGGRGIEFRFTSYEQFIETVGRRPTPKHSIDRIDPNGHYEPGNVRWASITEQIRNRRTTRFIVFRGKKTPVAELAKTYRIAGTTIRGRIILGWCIECAVTRPLVTKSDCNKRDLICPHIVPLAKSTPV